EGEVGEERHQEVNGRERPCHDGDVSAESEDKRGEKEGGDRDEIENSVYAGAQDVHAAIIAYGRWSPVRRHRGSAGDEGAENEIGVHHERAGTGRLLVPEDREMKVWATEELARGADLA